MHLYRSFSYTNRPQSSSRMLPSGVTTTRFFVVAFFNLFLSRLLKLHKSSRNAAVSLVSVTETGDCSPDPLGSVFISSEFLAVESREIQLSTAVARMVLPVKLGSNSRVTFFALKPPTQPQYDISLCKQYGLSLRFPHTPNETN